MLKDINNGTTKHLKEVNLYFHNHIHAINGHIGMEENNFFP